MGEGCCVRLGWARPRWAGMGWIGLGLLDWEVRCGLGFQGSIFVSENIIGVVFGST